MKTAIQNTFDGGLAEDVRTFSSKQAAYSSLTANFDVFTNPHEIRPYPDQVAETISTGSGVMTDFQITDVLPISISGTVKLVGWGRESAASSKASFFTKDAPISTAWAKIVTSGGSGTPVPGTLIEYQGDAYAIDSNPNLIKFTSWTTFTTIGTILGGGGGAIGEPKPFVHPEDDILYFAHANSIGTYDGSTFDGSVITVPSKWKITSLTNYGSYLAIACKPTLGIGKSQVFLWGRNTSITTFQGIIDWGDGNLELLENINEMLVGVSARSTIGTFDTTVDFTYQVKYYAGGTPQIIKDFTTGTVSTLRPWKGKKDNRLYFGFDMDNVLHVVGQNRSGEWIVMRDRYITDTGSTITGTLNNFSIVGDIFFMAYTDGGVDGYLTRSTETSYVNPSVFLTTVNPAMAIDDRYKEKSIVSVQAATEFIANSGTIGVSHYTESSSGTSLGTPSTIMNVSKSAIGHYTVRADANTSGQPLLSGKEHQFLLSSTGGVRFKELKYLYNDTTNP